MFSIQWVSISTAPRRLPPTLCSTRSGNPQLPVGSALRSLSRRSDGEEGTVTGSPRPLQASVRFPLAAPARASAPGDSFPSPAREWPWLLLNSSPSISCLSLYPAGPLGGTPPPRRNPTTSSDHCRPSLGACTTCALPAPCPLLIRLRPLEITLSFSVTWSLSTATTSCPQVTRLTLRSPRAGFHGHRDPRQVTVTDPARLGPQRTWDPNPLPAELLPASPAPPLSSEAPG